MAGLSKAPLVAALLFATAENLLGQAGQCLDLVELGPWAPFENTAAGPNTWAPPPTADDYLHAFPARVRLGSEQLDGRNTPPNPRYDLIIPASSQQTPHSFRFWGVANDTLDIFLGNGFSHIRARVTEDGPRWAGALRTWTDAIGTLLYQRSIVLERSDCGGPPPIRADADPPAPRSVTLTDGTVIELGLPLPQGVLVEPRVTEAWTVVGSVTGRFAGADTLIVELGRVSGRVIHIELRYPPGFDLQGLGAALAQEYRADALAQLRTWRNRTTRVHLQMRSPPYRPRVMLIDPRFR
jgi:hypothetical protein